LLARPSTLTILPSHADNSGMSSRIPLAPVTSHRARARRRWRAWTPAQRSAAVIALMFTSPIALWIAGAYFVTNNWVIPPGNECGAYTTGPNYEWMTFIAAFLLACAGTVAPLLLRGLRLRYRIAAFALFLPLDAFLFMFAILGGLAPCAFS
jgi:hypothetical protein